MIYEAQEELREGIRPRLRSLPQGFDQYDTVFLGFPNWWGTLPMPVVSFLEQENWRGKRIFPFVTSEGSGFADSLRDLEKYCPGAVIGEGLAIIGHKAMDSKDEIDAWVGKAIAMLEKK